MMGMSVCAKTGSLPGEVKAVSRGSSLIKSLPGALGVDKKSLEGSIRKICGGTMNIFIHQNNETTGPFDEDTLREMLKSGQLLLLTFACLEGESTWRPLSE